MHYSIRHVTRFRYSALVRQSVMELRMQPRSEGPQALRNFQVATNPRAQLYAYTDHLGNAVYHFNVLREHEELRIEAQSLVEMSPFHPLPDAADPLEWQRYNSARRPS
jgi:transglutaminase-like putative cysteine protease